ncbi:MAG: fused MFS/spermidine synthase [Chloroflexi bacterium]|nr:fused MFS/spermidine synthase [Chloroflexota bacterium]
MLFASGAAGLVYQVAWVRLLGLAFGVTIYAISTVLAAFMGGLAIGSLVGGRRADSVARPLRLYGGVELAVGATALLTPWAFRMLQDVYAGAAQVVDPSQAPVVAGTLRAGLAFVVLLVPTALMGATLPLAVRGVRAARAGEADRVGGDAWAMGLLYATNTAGAIVGCLASGLILIGSLGLSETITLAAGANAIAGAGALLLSLRVAGGPADGTRGVETRGRTPSDPPPIWTSELRRSRVPLIAFAVSGGISLAYEVVWSRILAVLFDASIYGFVLMLATVLAGIAIGGALGGALVRWRSSTRTSAIAFGAFEVGIGLAAVLALVVFSDAYTGLTTLRDSGNPLLLRFVRTDLRLMAMLCVLTVLPAALLMGATFPVAARLWAAGTGDGLGRKLGGVYAGNVAGAIVGSLAAGFVLVPLLGAHHSLLLLAGANVLVGVVLLLDAGQRAPAAICGLAGALVIAVGALMAPIHEVVFHEHFPDQQLLAYWEGLENTVSVGRDANGIQTLFTNSRGQTNDSPDLVRYHRVMGHLAALLAPSREPRVLVVGLGAGATPGALAQHSGARIDVVELSPSVVAAAPFFRVANADVLSQPNINLVVDDGRNYLLRNRQPYDVVTADVVHPYDAGATNLYSVEYFSLVARSLTRNGIMVQWVSPGTAFEHSLIIRTFLQAFPHATLWLGGDLLIGSNSPITLSRAELEARLADPSARSSLAEVGFNHAQDVLAQFRGTDAQLHAYVGASGPVLTDDHPILEYFESQTIPGEPPDMSTFLGPPPVSD